MAPTSDNFSRAAFSNDVVERSEGGAGSAMCFRRQAGAPELAPEAAEILGLVRCTWFDSRAHHAPRLP